MEVEQLTHNVKRFRVALPSPDAEIGMETPGMLMVKAPGDPKPAMKPYTPITLNTQRGYFDLVSMKSTIFSTNSTRDLA